MKRMERDLAGSAVWYGNGIDMEALVTVRDAVTHYILRVS